MSHIQENQKISPFLVFFLISSMQIGIGVLTFERQIASYAGHDAWMSIFISSLIIHLLLWMLYHVLTNNQGDIIEIHRTIFGKWLGSLLSLLLIVYFLALVLSVVRSYIDVIKIWIFPQLPVSTLAILILVLAYYFVLGDFRVVAGVCFLGIIIPLQLLLLKIFPLQHGHLSNLFPIFEHDVRSILRATREMTFSYIGIEMLLIYYPFIKKGPHSQKFAHYGVLFTTAVYLFSVFVTFVYFSQGQLQHAVWPTLNLWKIVDFPFIERFEYVGIAVWLTLILPNIALGLWGSLRGLRQLFNKQTRTLGFVIIIVLILIVSFIQEREQLKMVNDFISRIGFYVLLGYIPFLFTSQWIYRRVRKPS